MRTSGRAASRRRRRGRCGRRAGRGLRGTERASGRAADWRRRRGRSGRLADRRGRPRRDARTSRGHYGDGQAPRRGGACPRRWRGSRRCRRRGEGALGKRGSRGRALRAGRARARVRRCLPVHGERAAAGGQGLRRAERLAPRRLRRGYPPPPRRRSPLQGRLRRAVDRRGRPAGRAAPAALPRAGGRRLARRSGRAGERRADAVRLGGSGWGRVARARAGAQRRVRSFRSRGGRRGRRRADRAPRSRRNGCALRHRACEPPLAARAHRAVDPQCAVAPRPDRRSVAGPRLGLPDGRPPLAPGGHDARAEARGDGADGRGVARRREVDAQSLHGAAASARAPPAPRHRWLPLVGPRAAAARGGGVQSSAGAGRKGRRRSPLRPVRPRGSRPRRGVPQRAHGRAHRDRPGAVAGPAGRAAGEAPARSRRLHAPRGGVRGAGRGDRASGRARPRRRPPLARRAPRCREEAEGDRGTRPRRLERPVPPPRRHALPAHHAHASRRLVRRAAPHLRPPCRPRRHARVHRRGAEGEGRRLPADHDRPGHRPLHRVVPGAAVSRSAEG